MIKIDLNVDIGEGFAFDEALLDIATSASICCGEHAGHWRLTLATAEICMQKGVRIGAHPGFPERSTMGRGGLKTGDLPEFRDSIICQVQKLAEAVPVQYVKPHGALYNLLSDPSQPLYGEALEMVAAACRSVDLPCFMLPDVGGFRALQMMRVGLVAEGYADRAILPNGRLLPRDRPGAALRDPARIRSQVLRMVAKVKSVGVHGDSPGCVATAELVRKTLEDAHYEVGY